MSLTNRKRQFLTLIFKQYRDTREPVHYIEIADKLGVSKWTAYDIMKSLAEKGFLEVEYTIGGARSRGRSQVVFKPTSKTEELFYGVKGKEWDEIKDNLLKRFKYIKNNRQPRNIDEMLREIKNTKIPLFFSAYILALMLAHLVWSSQNILSVIKGMLSSSSNPDVLLVFFVGSALSSVLENSKQHQRELITQHVSEFNEHIVNISPNEKKLLVDFLKEALYHV